MKISRVPVRVAPRPTPSSGSMAHAPGFGASAMRPAPVKPPRPASVSATAWELLGVHVDDAQRRSAIAYTPLRAVVQGVVRELRAAGESWESVYAVLHSAVTPVAGRPVTWAAEYEMHSSRSAALVAHMHSWADVERLAELEGEDTRG